MILSCAKRIIRVRLIEILARHKDQTIDLNSIPVIVDDIVENLIDSNITTARALEAMCRKVK